MAKKPITHPDIDVLRRKMMLLEAELANVTRKYEAARADLRGIVERYLEGETVYFDLPNGMRLRVARADPPSSIA